MLSPAAPCEYNKIRNILNKKAFYSEQFIEQQMKIAIKNKRVQKKQTRLESWRGRRNNLAIIDLSL
ncbi:hypothetical protein D9K79_05150 [Acinetobacter cumulans]|uniref:Transposase n=1 Tax=Acinetobacter cumulans TaxID=2136182 RepID=A0ABX9U800_9GAMM|nr:hypothetical protein D9K79_05150 [Acinetobacter cumulans]